MLLPSLLKLAQQAQDNQYEENVPRRTRIILSGSINTLKDFGEVAFEEDTTLSASVFFEDGNGGSGNVDSNHGGEIRGFLPSTGGGMALAVLGAGVLLISGGLLVHRLTR